MLDNDDYQRKQLPVLAQRWDGGHAEAHLLAAWVIENNGMAGVTYIRDDVMLEVKTAAGPSYLTKGNYLVRDADGNWCIRTKTLFESYFEPIDKESPDDGPSHALAS